MALNNLRGSNRSETGSSGWSRFMFHFFSSLFFGRISPSERCCPFNVWKIFPTTLVPLHMTCHFSSVSPKRMFLSDTKNQNSRYIFPFCFPYSFALKNMFLLIFFFFFFLFKFQMSLCGSRAYSICSYMCWASIMSKYLASMIWGSTLFLNTEQR